MLFLKKSENNKRSRMISDFGIKNMQNSVNSMFSIEENISLLFRNISEISGIMVILDVYMKQAFLNMTEKYLFAIICKKIENEIF
jgi:hypothetical protein